MPSLTSAVRTTTSAVTADPRRWWALVAVAIGQLVITADATIMNIALPTVQRALQLTDVERQWVITIFALGYGGLLLLGGRLSGLIGRKRCLLIGLAGLALASVLGGVAVNPAMLLASRGLQGVFGALFTPAVLALIGTTFTTPDERAKAFGIYGTVMGSSSGIGLILGGLLTDYAGWRWSLFVSVPVAAIAAVGVVVAVPATPRRTGTRVDLVGAALVTSGLMALVYGFSEAESGGWTTPSTMLGLAAGLVLLALFVGVENRTTHALLPLRVVLHRRRGGAYLAVLCMAVGNFAGSFFLTFYLQNVLGYAPLTAGLAFLPYTAAIILGVRLARRIVASAPVRWLLCPGLLVTAASLALLGLLRPDSDYATHLLPVVVLLGLGNAWVLVPANNTATLGAGPDAGVAGATVMTSMQVGSSLGVALLGSIAGSAAADFRHTHAPAAGLAAQAAVHGYNVASLAAAGFLCLAAVAVFLIIGRDEARR